MATFHFVSGSQLMFTVMCFDGRKILVHFTERDGNGRSSFITSNEKVAQAIKGHSFFRKGRIELAGVENTKKEEEEKDVVRFAPEPKAVKPEVKTEESDETAEFEETADLNDNAELDENADLNDNAELEENAEETAQIPEGTDEDDSNLNFENITLAKDYLHRRFGIAKTEIRSISKTIDFAKSKGLNITIGSGTEEE